MLGKHFNWAKRRILRSSHSRRIFCVFIGESQHSRSQAAATWSQIPFYFSRCKLSVDAISRSEALRGLGGSRGAERSLCARRSLTADAPRYARSGERVGFLHFSLKSRQGRQGRKAYSFVQMSLFFRSNDSRHSPLCKKPTLVRGGRGLHYQTVKY